MFLLVPAHPGCPGQIPQSHKTVVCVCVCVCVHKYRHMLTEILFDWPLLWSYHCMTNPIKSTVSLG